MEPESQSLVAILQPSVYLQAVLAKLFGNRAVWLFSRSVALWVSYLQFMNHQGPERDALDHDRPVSALVM